MWHYIHGPLFQVLKLYSYILAFLAFLIVISQLFTCPDYYRRQTAILLVASAIPFAFNIVYILQPAGFPQFDITPFSFSLMGILIAVGIIRFRLFSIMPVAHSYLFNEINDAVFVTDQGDTVIDLNPAASNLLDIPGKVAIGRNFRDLFPEFVSQDKDFSHSPENRPEIRIVRNKTTQYYEASDLPVFSRESKIGKLLILYDITGRRTALNALEAANIKLNMLSDITRHDITNQITVLLGYIELTKKKISDPEPLSYIAKAKQSATTIRQQIGFTSEYQDIGKQAPKWQSVNKSFFSAATSHTLGNVVVRGDDRDIDIFTDPLFEKVFYNLIDNSLRYGGSGLKNIWISSKETDDGLVIRYDDDGAGIPEPINKSFSPVVLAEPEAWDSF